jgi:hypothetical protein
VPVVPDTSSQRNATCTSHRTPGNTKAANTTNDCCYSPKTSSNQGAHKSRQSSARKVVNAGDWRKDGKVCIATVICNTIYIIHCFDIVTYEVVCTSGF